MLLELELPRVLALLTVLDLARGFRMNPHFEGLGYPGAGATPPVLWPTPSLGGVDYSLSLRPTDYSL